MNYHNCRFVDEDNILFVQLLLAVNCGMSFMLNLVFFLISFLYNLQLLSICDIWLLKLRHLQLAKVECIKLEASFMSEQAPQFLSVIGLLGEYCPPSKDKDRHSAHKLGCMHLELQGYNINFQGCQFMRPFPSGNNFHHTEEILVEEDQLLPF
ncbi:Uncharacterized protein Fot_51190 [Forsythia ovata]|uniref:Uncharacterized protein n=1 Tax=Forsythia ovata TaxID=205694 RepID=A0ABD1PUD6_9LAMI